MNSHLAASSRPLLSAAVIWLSCAAGFNTALVFAADMQSLEDIRSAVAVHVASTVSDGKPEINVSPLDGRLRLDKCAHKLQTSTVLGNAAAGNLTVAVKCPAPQWSLMVPVKVQYSRQVFVASHPLMKGQLITAEDVQLQEHVVTSLPLGYLTGDSELLGKRVKRHIPAGTILSPLALESSPVINRGAEVVLLVKTAQLEVRMKGEALTDGRPNEMIRVRNLQSKRIVEGLVLATGEVQVSM